MDPRYQWPPQPQGYSNGQYAPSAQPNGYPSNGYPPQYPPQPMPQDYSQSQSQSVQGHPRVLIHPRPSQQYPPNPDELRAQPRTVQPQVVIPARNPNPIAQMQNPRIRQVQVPVQRPLQSVVGGGVGERRAIHPQPRAPQTPTSKSAHQSHSSQENPPRSQLRTPSVSVSSQHRTPLQPQSTPRQRTASQTHTPQSPALSHTSSQSRSHPQVVIKKSAPPSIQTPTKPPHVSPPKALPTDLAVLMLSAADEYINAAHGMGSVAAMTQRTEDLQQYYRLMATGLGCMEAVLKRYNQIPRDEARLRLRYASLLVEETENSIEIEEVLTKGISLCNRSRLIDLKYSMQHLQARYQFRSNHRAALKLLDQVIGETETFQHHVWIYAFRFLKVSLALQVPGRPELASALQQLHAIASHAERKGDRAIFVTCSALEAMIHLRTPGADHLEHAQRAIAAARSLQLQLTSKQLGQVGALIDSIDIACCIQHGESNTQTNNQKMLSLQSKADQEPGPDNGVFSVLIEKSFGGSLTFSTGGVFRKAEDGRDELVFSWLPKNDLRILTYYLSGMITLPHDKGVAYLQEGFKLTQDALRRHYSFGTSIPASVNQRNWMAILDWQLRFVLGVVAVHHQDKSHPKQALASLQARVPHPPFNNAETYTRLVSYLSAVYQQTIGSLDSALSTYSQPVFNLPDAGAASDFKTDIAILAAMNRILIVRNPAHPEHYLTRVLFSQLEPLCTSHPNRYIKVALSIIRALTTSDNSINRQKTLIHNALTASQALQNQQFMAMCLSYMTNRFFADQVGDQAVKSVRAARSVAVKGRSVLWRAVAYGLCINTFQRNGLLTDAQECESKFEELKEMLPLPLKAGGGGVVIRDGDVDVKME